MQWQTLNIYNMKTYMRGKTPEMPEVEREGEPPFIYEPVQGFAQGREAKR